MPRLRGRRGRDRLDEDVHDPAADGGTPGIDGVRQLDAHELGDGTVPPELEAKARNAAANCPEYAIEVTE